MTKNLGASFLVAGTCIGSGMIALPMVLSSFGLFYSFIFMFSVWLLMYFSSLISLELNLKANKGLALGPLAQHFSGPKAKLIGNLSLKILSTSLMSVYLYGGASIVNSMLGSLGLIATANLPLIISLFALLLSIIFLLPIKGIERCNRYFFIVLLGLVVVLIFSLTPLIELKNLPLMAKKNLSFSDFSIALPVVFTSFGFQVIFHTLTNYCNKDARALKKSFFFGSLLANFVYLLWTFVVLSAIYSHDNHFYDKMSQGNAIVGDLIASLSSVTKWEHLELLSWLVTLLAIFTSAIGVGIGLIGSFEQLFQEKFKQEKTRKILAVVSCLLPPFILAILVPNAFINLLAFAGLILAIIAILLPSYLLLKAKLTIYNYSILKHKWLIGISIIIAMVVIFCEIYNFFK